MPGLDYITVKGFKSIASMEKLKLGPINVIIGPNGAGKSNFIGVFGFLHALREGHLQEYVTKAGGADKVLHFGVKTTSELLIDISFKEESFRYRIRLKPTEYEQLYPANESTSYHDDHILLPARGLEAGISNSDCTGIVRYVRLHLDYWLPYHFHDTSSTSPMKKTADLHDNRFLRRDGSNLAAVLYYMRLKHEATYSLIRRTVQLMAPFFDDFVLEPQKLNPEKIFMEWRHKGSDQYFAASSFSDGTLRFIALATLFLQPEESRPSVILVDEPEIGLHPVAITLLASLIRSVATKTQVIVATESSLLLDHFEPEEVLVADRVNGSTQFTRLEKARLESWLEDYSLGQLWEKNELGGRPSRG